MLLNDVTMTIEEIDKKMSELDDKFHKLRGLAEKIAVEMDNLGAEYAQLKAARQKLINNGK